MIDREKFKQATGREPENDDLERCNCSQAGQFGHKGCGWCHEHDLPAFQCGCGVLTGYALEDLRRSEKQRRQSSVLDLVCSYGTELGEIRFELAFNNTTLNEGSTSCECRAHVELAAQAADTARAHLKLAELAHYRFLKERENG